MGILRILIILLPIFIIISPVFLLFFENNFNNTIPIIINVFLPFLWLIFFIMYFVKQKITQNNFWFFIICIVLLFPLSFYYLFMAFVIKMSGSFGP
jgi:hypothetical protein